MVHQPVFKNFILGLLGEEDRIILDATLGEGGHTLSFLQAGKRVIAFERDPRIKAEAESSLRDYIRSGQLIIHGDNYRHIQDRVKEGVDLALFDLGISKYHYAQGGRGFTFQKNEPLDMRLDGQGHPHAGEIINQWQEEDLANLFYRYGEETLSRPCARLIVRAREQNPIDSASQLAELVSQVYRQKKVKTSIHPATKIFQALRIEVNRELEHIIPGVNGGIELLNPGGRAAVIAYHSLEDRLVKETMVARVPPRKNVNKYLPLHRQGIESGRTNKNTKTFSFLNKKVIRPSREEIAANPSARSACLRILIRGLNSVPGKI